MCQAIWAVCFISVETTILQVDSAILSSIGIWQTQKKEAKTAICINPYLPNSNLVPPHIHIWQLIRLQEEMHHLKMSLKRLFSVHIMHKLCSDAYALTCNHKMLFDQTLSKLQISVCFKELLKLHYATSDHQCILHLLVPCHWKLHRRECCYLTNDARSLL